jgi:tetratricopeptide (TPR) repeat protein
MIRISGVIGICCAMCLVGCASFKKLTASKPKTNSSSVGSANFSNSKKLKNPAKIHLAYAGWHEQTGNHQEARRSYQKVLEKSPKDVEALLGLARIDQMYDRDEECDQNLEKALKYHPKDPKVFVAIGQVHSARNEWPMAVEKMKAAQKLAPFDPIYEYHLAVAEAHVGEMKSALEHFTRSVGQAEAHYNIGFILNEQGNTADAEVHLKKALQLKPELKQAEATLAEVRAANADSVQPASFNGTKD